MAKSTTGDDPSDIYIPIPMPEFMGEEASPVDLFIQLASKKMVQVIRRGTPASAEQFTRYREKGINKLFIRQDDFGKYISENLRVSKAVINNNKMPLAAKAAVLNTASSAIMVELMELGLSRVTYGHAKEMAAFTINIVEKKPDFSIMMQSLKNLPANVLGHSVAVSILAPIIGMALGWQRRPTLEKLALGGLLHDIGKNELPKELLEKRRCEMSAEEIQLYESHCFRGYQQLQSIVEVPEDVLMIVYQHHENAIGQGFPRALTDMNQHPLARIVSLVNHFIDLTLGTPLYPNKISAPEAIRQIELVLSQPYNREAFAALKQIVHGHKRGGKTAA